MQFSAQVSSFKHVTQLSEGAALLRLIYCTSPLGLESFTLMHSSTKGTHAAPHMHTRTCNLRIPVTDFYCTAFGLVWQETFDTTLLRHFIFVEKTTIYSASESSDLKVCFNTCHFVTEHHLKLCLSERKAENECLGFFSSSSRGSEHSANYSLIFRGT